MIRKKIALITGASSGLGYEMAKLFAKDGCHLVLVARSEEKLLELSQMLTKEYKVSTFIIVKDLSNPGAAGEIYNELAALNIDVNILVNNAGFGDHGAFATCDLERQLQMIQVNVNALVSLTGCFLPQMIAAGYGGILNIASVAGFQPGPYMSIYYATKSFVLSFSDALSYELKNTGVWVTTVCPGPTKTNFGATAKANKLFKSFKLADASDVAYFAYRAFMNKQGVVIPGFLNNLMVFVQRFTPRMWAKKIVANVQR